MCGLVIRLADEGVEDGEFEVEGREDEGVAFFPDFEEFDVGLAAGGSDEVDVGFDIGFGPGLGVVSEEGVVGGEVVLFSGRSDVDMEVVEVDTDGDVLWPGVESGVGEEIEKVLEDLFHGAGRIGLKGEEEVKIGGAGESGLFGEGAGESDVVEVGFGEVFEERAEVFFGALGLVLAVGGQGVFGEDGKGVLVGCHICYSF